MNNKKLAIGALIVVLLSGLIMYVTKNSETETQGQIEQPVQKPAEQVAAEMTPPPAETVPAQPEPVQAQPEPVNESLGASSSGLGR